MPSIIAALPIGLIGGQRRAFSRGDALGGPGAMIVLSHVMVWIVSHLQAMPLVYVGAMWLTYFLCFLMILRTGAQLGMLIIIIAVLVSVMGLNSIAAAEAMRDGFTQASLLSLVLGRLVHALLPARTAELHVRDPQPAPGNVGVGAAIRASLLLLVSLWLYTVLQPSDIMLAMITAMVLVFPTGKAALAEANERVLVTLYGGAMTAVVLALVIAAHKLMDQSVVVLNKGAGSGAEAFLYAKENAGNPTKLIFGTNNAYLLPHVGKMAYSFQDLTPVAALALDEFIVWVKAHAPYQTLPKLVDAAKAAPGTIPLAAASPRTPTRPWSR